MFPTFVWKAQLPAEGYEPANDLIVQTLGEIEPTLTDLKRGESWQSGPALHEMKQFEPLVEAIDDAVKSVLDYLRVGHRIYKITGCWATVNAPGAAHGIHSHPNNYLSGVYYVRTGEGANTISFIDPRFQTGILRPPVTEMTAENTDQVVVTVRDGTLLMFPAWLQHSVDPNRCDRPRVSISFNVMLSDYEDTLSQPGWEGRWRSSVTAGPDDPTADTLKVKDSPPGRHSITTGEEVYGKFKSLVRCGLQVDRELGRNSFDRQVSRGW